MFKGLHRPSPALVVALVALFVALGGTAGAVVTKAVPLAKRALVADNAKKLQGKTLAEVAALPGPATTLGGKTADEIAATPGPASTAVSLTTVKTAPFSLGGGQVGDFTVSCDAGQKAIAGGYDNPSGVAIAFDTRPTPDGASWKIFLAAGSSGASGTVVAICLR